MLHLTKYTERYCPYRGNIPYIFVVGSVSAHDPLKHVLYLPHPYLVLLHLMLVQFSTFQIFLTFLSSI